MNSLSAVYFEQKDFDKCIKECQEAVEIGRENRSDFKLIAKYVYPSSFIPFVKFQRKSKS